MMGTHHLNHVRGMHIKDFKKVRPHAWNRRGTESMPNLDTAKVKCRAQLVRVTTAELVEIS
jgi:hypothetical protein